MIWRLPLPGRAQVREKTRARSDTKRQAAFGILGFFVTVAAIGGYYLVTTWTTPIVVARNPLPAYSLLTADDLATEHVSALDHVFPGSMPDISSAVNKYTTVPLAPSQPILAQGLQEAASSGDRVINGVTVSNGLQLVAANVSLDDAAGGYIDKGSRVNLVRLPSSAPGAPANREVTLFASNILVIARPGDQQAPKLSLANLNAPINSQPIEGNTARLVFAAQPELALRIAGYAHTHELGVLVPVGDTDIAVPMSQPLDQFPVSQPSPQPSATGGH